MAEIQPFQAVTYNTDHGVDVSDRIAPPYDVLDEKSKGQLLRQSAQNIVTIDLPHLPAKSVGPTEVYRQAGQVYRKWLSEKILTRRQNPALFVYQQTFSLGPRVFKRRGLVANVHLQSMGTSKAGRGSIHPHEQVFPAAKEDRLKLMYAAEAQLSAIFGIYSDPDQSIAGLLSSVIDGRQPLLYGTTLNDQVKHELWAVEEPQQVAGFRTAMAHKDLFIADGHHRYQTALTYAQQKKSDCKNSGNANYCLFVLVALEDPGMIVLPTHRVLTGLTGFSTSRLKEIVHAQDNLNIRKTPFGPGQLEQLAASLGQGGPHEIGLLSGPYCHILSTHGDHDPLKDLFPNHPKSWRLLDVAILHEIWIERVFRPNFGGSTIHSSYTANLSQVAEQIQLKPPGNSLGLILRAPSLESIHQVSLSGHLMPQKSTFFYPKVATGLVINPLS